MNDLEEKYNDLFNNGLRTCAQKLESFLQQNIDSPARIDRISVRAKTTDRFLSKAAQKVDGEKKYNDPLSEIQDIIGARIVCLYLEDVEKLKTSALEILKPVEYKSLEPERFSEFGYFGWHTIAFLPREVTVGIDQEKIPKFFELQIKTVFQHAWSEASHDLSYKQLSGEVTGPQKRLIAFSAAQAWGADNTFQAVLGELELDV